MGSSTRSDDTDWHAYLEDKYGVSTIPRQYSARDMAKFIDSVVTLMFQQELYPTYRALECIANNIPLEHKKEFLDMVCDGMEQSFFSVTDLWEMFYQFNLPVPVTTLPTPPVAPVVDFIPNENIAKPQYYPREVKQHLHDVMQYVSVPTQYLSPDGFVTIHYDRDHLDCYEAQVRHNEELEYYVRENVSMLERALFLRYFGDR